MPLLVSSYYNKMFDKLTVCNPRLCDQASILLMEEEEAAMNITAKPPCL